MYTISHIEAPINNKQISSVYGIVYIKYIICLADLCSEIYGRYTAQYLLLFIIQTGNLNTECHTDSQHMVAVCEHEISDWPAKVTPRLPPLIRTSKIMLKIRMCIFIYLFFFICYDEAYCNH